MASLDLTDVYAKRGTDIYLQDSVLVFGGANGYPDKGEYTGSVACVYFSEREGCSLKQYESNV